MSNMSDWAKREVELACKKEKAECEHNEWNYGCACYKSALKAFNSLLEDEHSGFSISVTKHILKRLIDGKPLTPIDDTEEDWEYSRGWNTDIFEVYQNKRMSSLFKYVYKDGSIKYDDVNRFICVNDESDSSTYCYKFIVELAEEYVGEITMPYSPMSEPIKIVCEEHLSDSKNGDFDTIMVYDIRVPNGKDFDIIKVNRYFKWDEGIDESWVEISEEQLSERMNGKGAN